MFSPFRAWARTSMPLSQLVEQLPHDVHCPSLVVIRKRDHRRCLQAAEHGRMGHPNRPHTRLPRRG